MSVESPSLQAAIRRECADLVGTDFLRGLHGKEARTFLLTVAHLWLAIAATFAVAIALLSLSGWALAVAWLPLVLFMGTRINALNVQVHEGSHRVLTESHRWNDLLCNWLAAYPTLYDVDQYSAVHTRHHVHLSEEGDPEMPYYELPPTRREIARAFLADFFWVTFARRLLTVRDAMATSARTRVRTLVAHLLGRLACLAGMIGLLAWAVGLPTAVLFYFLFWIVPLLSVYPMLIRVRQVTEHHAPPEETASGPVFVARTSATGWLEHYLLGAQMEYHFEHHLFPSVPYEKLRLLHERLHELRFFDTSTTARPEHSLSPGYLAYWRRAAGRERAASAA